MLDNLDNLVEKFKSEMKENIANDEKYKKVEEKIEMFYFDILSEFKNEINELKKEHQILRNEFNDLKKRMDDLYKDIYDEYEDFNIICPYCNYEFCTEIDEDVKEVCCPECGNDIELDWSGNPDSDVIDDNGCGGNCSHCNGCE